MHARRAHLKLGHLTLQLLHALHGGELLESCLIVLASCKEDMQRKLVNHAVVRKVMLDVC